MIAHDEKTRRIALSGSGSAEDLERSRTAGFDRHLTQPVSLEDLLRAVEDVTRRGRGRAVAAAGASA